MPTQNVTQKHSHFRLDKLTQIQRLETDREIREAIAASSVRFVTSRLRYFLTERGLNTSGGVK